MIVRLSPLIKRALTGGRDRGEVLVTISRVVDASQDGEGRTGEEGTAVRAHVETTFWWVPATNIIVGQLESAFRDYREVADQAANREVAHFFERRMEPGALPVATNTTGRRFLIKARSKAILVISYVEVYGNHFGDLCFYIGFLLGLGGIGAASSFSFK